VLAVAAVNRNLSMVDDIGISAFHAVLLLLLLMIYDSLFLSGVYYCLSVFWCAVARMSELELVHRTNIKFLVKLDKSGSEIRELLVQVYGDVFLFPNIKEILK
jgi:hypothetical protein